MRLRMRSEKKIPERKKKKKKQKKKQNTGRNGRKVELKTISCLFPQWNRFFFAGEKLVLPLPFLVSVISSSC
jgi:hypothetical protein